MTSTEPRQRHPVLRNRIALAVFTALVVLLGLSTLYRAGPYEINGRPWGSSRHRTDFTIYTEVGKALLEGRNIYDVKNRRGWHYNNAPLFGLLFVPFALLPLPLAVLLWYLLSVAAIAAGVHFSVRMAGGDSGGDRFWLLVVPPLLVGWPILSALARGQTTPLLFALTAAALFWAWKGRDWPAGACLAAAALMKVFPALLLGYYAWRRRWKFVGITLLMLGAGVWAPAAVLGWNRNLETHQRWVSILCKPTADPEQADDPRHGELNSPRLVRNQSLPAVLVRITDRDEARWAGVAIGLAMVAAIFAVGRKAAADHELHVLAMGVIWMLLMSPVSWAHYFMILIFPLALLVRSARERGDKRLWGVLVAFGVLAIGGSLDRDFHFFGPLCWASLVVWAALLGITGKSNGFLRSASAA